MKFCVNLVSVSNEITQKITSPYVATLGNLSIGNESFLKV